MERSLRSSIESVNPPRRGSDTKAGLLWILLLFLLFACQGLAETLPFIEVADASIVEGNTGTTNLVFKLLLSKASSRMVMADYATRDVTATAGEDYSAAFGVAIFEPGSTCQNILVSIQGDLLNEDDEIFWLTLARPVNATLSRSHAVGTILNDDLPPTVSIHDSPIMQVRSGFTNANFKVNLSESSGQTITVDLLTRSGAARSGRDFVPVADTLTFTPGTTTQMLAVPINGNSRCTSNEFFVILTNAVNATLARNEAVCTIKNEHPFVVTSRVDPFRPAPADRFVPAPSRSKTESIPGNSLPAASSLFRPSEGIASAIKAPQPITPPANIILSSASSTNFIHVERPLVFTLRATNTGPVKAESVVVTDRLPASATVLSVQVSQGSYAFLSNSIICKFGDLPLGAEATAMILTKLGAAGLATNSAVMTALSAITSAETFSSIVVYATNDPPVIFPIADQVTAPNTPTRPIPFTVSDNETAAEDLIVLGACSDTNLVPDENLIFSGNGRDRSLIIVPAPAQSGVAIITLNLFDGDGGVAEQSFNVNVAPQPETSLRLQRDGEILILSFEAESDVSYVIEYCDSRLFGSWKQLTTVSPLPLRALVNVTETIRPQQQRYYRLRASP